MDSYWSTVLLLTVLVAASNVFPAEAPRSHLDAIRLEQPLSLDGRLDEPVWLTAPAAEDFKQWSPERGRDAQLATEVRVAYDERYLYVGARMHNAGGPSRIAAPVLRRDRDDQSDSFGVFLDVERQGRVARIFRVSAANVQRDLIYVESRNEADASWDGVWDSAVSIDEGGWSAELRIPLSLLGVSGSGLQNWGIYFDRVNQHPFEVTGRMYVPRGERGFISRFETLGGVKLEESPRRRELIAHASARAKLASVAPYDDRGGSGRLGLDGRLGLGGGQLDLSLAPDFGQVEVDQAVLNLSTTETLFPEKRPFFTERAELFKLADATLFYSRRIGRALPDPPLESGDTLRRRPLSADVVGSARYSLSFGEGWTLALLGAHTREAMADLRAASEDERRLRVEPSASFGVLRATRQIDERGSYLGAFASWAHQHSSEGRDGRVGALDAAWNSANHRTQIHGHLSGSLAGPSMTVPGGLSAHGQLRHGFSGAWTATADATYRSRHYDPNDLGYLDRADLREGWLSLGRTWDRTAGVFRNWQVAGRAIGQQDQAGHTLMRGVELNGGTEFTNLWRAKAYLVLRLAADDDRELRTFLQSEKVYLRRPARQFATLELSSAPAARWSFRSQLRLTPWEGGPTLEGDLTQVLRPSSRFSAELTTRYVSAAGERRWLTTPSDGSPVVGLRSLSQLDQTLRLSYAFTPRATVQLFSQWMVARWSFRDLERWGPSGSEGSAEADGPTRFADRLWNLNLLWRWEFRPGSAAYLVYTRAVTDPRSKASSALAQARLVGDLADLHGLPSQDVLQLKLSWFF